MFDYLVVGAGYAGAVCARLLAENHNAKVLVIDRRHHIAGNMYDSINQEGILTHWYGPHISVMNDERVFRFLSRFTQWQPYHHRVNALIDGIEVPLPINFTAIDLLYPVDKAIELKGILTRTYGRDRNIAILDMMKAEDSRIQEFSSFIFERVFLHYTKKMWGLRPEDIDPAVTGRIPVRLSYDNRHFLHTYQVMPKNGFTELFKNMLDHSNIEIRLNTSADSVLKLSNEDMSVFFENQIFTGKVIYTGALDELFQYSEGELPYRSLEFKFRTFYKDYIQESSVLNWPDARPETRRTEMKRLTGQKKEGVTSTIVERPGAYVRGGKLFSEPLYPIDTPACLEVYRRYKARLTSYQQIIPVGRLADYKYYNMETVILRAMEAVETLDRKR